jgi:hypothetical protein
MVKRKYRAPGQLRSGPVFIISPLQSSAALSAKPAFAVAFSPRIVSLSATNQEIIMGKGNNSQKKEVKKPKKEKPKVLATRKTN